LHQKNLDVTQNQRKGQMEQALADQIERYRAQYSQAIRDLAETYCSSTTRLQAAGAPLATPDALMLIANRHEVDVKLLHAAIGEYSQIDAAMHREALRKLPRRSTPSASPAPARRWRWWPWS
jgi:hypothetical protein